MSLNHDDDATVPQSDDAWSEDGTGPGNVAGPRNDLSKEVEEVLDDDPVDDADVIPELQDDDSNEGDDRDASPKAVEAADIEPVEKPLHAERPDSSLDETASIPDDTPSVQGSILSSPRSRTPSLVNASSPLRNESPSSPHRPFDRRFQSRISSSPSLTPRARSPNFISSHSRQSSLGSIAFPTVSEPDEAAAPWEVIRWTKLKKLSGQVFSEIGKRNFGYPTCLVVTDQIVVGTSRGMVFVFDHQQNPKVIIGAGTKAVENGSVTSLAISADHTTVAAGHSTGHIFTWEISRPGRPFLHIVPVENAKPQARKGDGHMVGSAVVHIGFLGYRRTALVSADDKGMAFSHLASRGMGAVARTVRTTRILGRYPEVITRSAKPLKKSSMLAFSPLPLGNVEQKTDTLGLVAMLTPYLLVIVSTTPLAQTQHKAARPKEVAAHGAMTAALAWFPAIKLKGDASETSKAKLAYAWSNILTILEVHEVAAETEEETDKPPELQFLVRSRHKAEEAIVAVQWLSKSVLAVLTITQQLMIMEDISMTVSDSFDLLQKNVYHTDLYSQQLQAVIESLDEEDASMHGVVADAFHMSFRAYKGRLFLLGFNDIWWGTLTNWADRLLALMNIGDFIAAVRLATRYYSGHGEKLTIGLPEDASARTAMVGEKLFDMMSASLRYAFGKNQQAGAEIIEKDQLADLAEACVASCLVMDAFDFLFEEVFSWYDEHAQGELFIDVLEPYVLDSRVSTMPPPAIKVLIDHFAATHSPAKLEEIICLLDTTTMDIDQVTTLCMKYNLFDAYIYVWNRALNDFVTPLEQLLQLADETHKLNGHIQPDFDRLENAHKIFPYLSFVLTSRTYPTGVPLDDDLADSAKSQIYDYLFSAIPSKSQGLNKQRRRSMSGTMPYSNLRRVLAFDTPSFISSLNEAFEDSFLNSSDDDSANGVAPHSIALQKTSYNRQFIVRIMLEVMTSGSDPEDTIYLDMFIARNLPKYPQYMLLSGTTMNEIFVRLCHYPETSMREDAQLSVEYLLSKYQPSNLQSLIPLLREAQFYRILKSVFRQERQYVDVISMYFADPDDQELVFDALRELLGAASGIPDQQKQSIFALMENRAEELIQIDIRKTAMAVDNVAPALHQHFLESIQDDTFRQFEYLHPLFESKRDESTARRARETPLLELYVRLMCEYNPDDVSDFVETIKEGDLRLAQVLPAMEKTGVIDAAVVLEARSGQVRESMSRLTKHLASLQEALHALLAQKQVPEQDSLQRPIESLLTSVEKYSKVGIWLCQGQSKISQRPKATPKSPKRSLSISQPLLIDEELWLDLIDAVVSIARESPRRSLQPAVDQDSYRNGSVLMSLRQTIQEVFTALLAATSIPREGGTGASDLTFLRILRAFLTNAAKVSPSLSELRNVLSSIFSAYAHEESLLALSNAMLDKDVFVYLDHVKQLRLRGWRPKGQVCEVCRRRLWGPGVGEQVWEAWEQKEEARKQRRLLRSEFDTGEELDTSRGKGKAAALPTTEELAGGRGKPSAAEHEPIVVFSCRHMYHQKCLSNRQSNEEEHSGVASLQANVQLGCPACIADT